MRKEHILVIRFSTLSDVAMAVPVVHSLAMSYPDVRITMLSRGYARPLFEDLAPNVSFMEANLKRDYNSIRGLNTLYRRLTAKNFTAIADLHDAVRSEYLRMRFNLDRYKVAHIDKHRKGRRMLVAHKNKALIHLPSAFENYTVVFEQLGYPIKEMNFRSIFPPEGGNLNLLPAIIGSKNSFEKWVGIAPFAAHEGKNYPRRRMYDVMKMIEKKYPDARIFLLGRGEHERDTFPKWAAADSRCVDVEACLEIMQQELILMSHLDVMVSMDSTNMHLASLVGIPVVSVWGSTHPYAGSLGWNQDERNIVQTDLPCRPCSINGSRSCFRGDYACLYDIMPEQIFERVDAILSQTKGLEQNII